MDPAVPIPSPLADALATVDKEIKNLLDETHLAPKKLDSFVKISTYVDV